MLAPSYPTAGFCHVSVRSEIGDGPGKWRMVEVTSSTTGLGIIKFQSRIYQRHRLAREKIDDTRVHHSNIKSNDSDSMASKES